MTRFLRLPILLTATAMLSSCIVPGTYRIYRVAAAETELGLDCFNGMPNQNVSHTSDFRSGNTFAIFASDGSTYWLDLAAESVPGTKDKPGKYTFEGETVDVDATTPTAVTTTVRRMTVDLELSGRKISGTSTDENISTCQGADCPMNFNSSCTTTTDWEGSEIKDAELQHPV